VPFLDRSGVKIYYEDNGHDPAILLSHGYGATCRMWDAQIAAFVPHNRIIVWDMRGHGETDDPKDPAAYSEAALMHHHRIERAVIGGLSLGGYMSLAFHLAYPEIVGALTLFDTGPGFRNADARRAWTERAQQWARDLEASGFAALGKSEEGPRRQASLGTWPRRCGARHARAGRRHHRRARQDRRADPGAGRRQ
jgi:pimeloyl-ACP methyl ester carboxylesterase